MHKTSNLPTFKSVFQTSCSHYFFIISFIIHACISFSFHIHAHFQTVVVLRSFTLFKVRAGFLNICNIFGLDYHHEPDRLVMSSKQRSSLLAAAVLLSIAPSATAATTPIIPCKRGWGDSNGCGFPANASAVTPTAWDKATTVHNFTLPGAEAKLGGGYDVYWSVGHIDETCRVIITQPFTQEEHDEKLSGNVILSVSHPGCYYAHIAGDFAVGYCCGNSDCSNAGAGGIAKRSALSGRGGPSERRRSTEISPYAPLEARGWDSTPAPEESKAPEPSKAGWTCENPKPSGDPYKKAGPQQIDGNILDCNGGQVCSLSPSMAVTASNSVTNEKSTTLTDSTGASLSIEAGFNLPVGPTGSVTGTVSQDFSKAVAESLSETKDTSVSKTITMDISLVPGNKYNLWFTPTLECQKMSMKCNDQEVIVEKCDVAKDANGFPEGEHGVMTVG